MNPNFVYGHILYRVYTAMTVGGGIIKDKLKYKTYSYIYILKPVNKA